MSNLSFKKRLGILLLSVFSIFIIFSGCENIFTEADIEGIIPARGVIFNVYISSETPVSGTLHFQVYKTQNDLNADPDVEETQELNSEVGEIYTQDVMIKLTELTERGKVYPCVWLDEDSDGVKDADEFLEYYGNVAVNDLRSNGGRGITALVFDGEEPADFILDKKVNSVAHVIPSDGFEVTAYFSKPAGDWLICPCYKGSGGSVWKAQDWTLDPVSSVPAVTGAANNCTQSEFENGGYITFAINNSQVGAESGVYVLVRGSSASNGSNPAAGNWFEYYNNKNSSQAQANEVGTIPVGSGIDIILDVTY